MSLCKTVVSKVHDIWVISDADFDTHSSKGSKESGYRQPLVRGTHSFSYGYSLVIDKFRKEFLKHGYIKINFLQPMYSNRNVKIILNQHNANEDTFSMKYIDEESNVLYTACRGTNCMNKAYVKHHSFTEYI
eukprot:11941_1